ncbi:hypothetical protein SCLCIDRAFT_1215606 [Scleroderma citrinum Foug A]|uniref:Uncharacterized protein n=1 Tax=Scleroderma citrinum Foug A TaxID=1036808 RepID=A0A0C3E1L8_9AGAM|nr:hypothetical protein SCLCIDRAFT_1215606 [Scleroderma citrinum Foug A]
MLLSNLGRRTPYELKHVGSSSALVGVFQTSLIHRSDGYESSKFLLEILNCLTEG